MLDAKDLNFSDAVRYYKSDWEELIRSQDINPSFLPDWISCVFSAFKLSEQLRVFILLENDEVVGLLPYYRSVQTMMGIKLKAINFGGNLVSYHQEIISKNHHKELIEKFIEYHSMNGGWDIINASAILKNSTANNVFYEVLKKYRYGFQSLNGESSPYLDLEPGWDTILASKARKFRYKVNKREKEINANDDWSIRWFSSQNNTDDLLDAICRIEEKSWKVASGMDITANKVELEYYRQLLPFIAKKEILLANVLYIGEKAVAYNLCYLWNQKVGQIKTSYDDDYKQYSPGAVIIEDALRYLCQNNMKEFDFLGDEMPHKLLWTKKVRTHESLFIFSNSPKAWLLYKMKVIKNKLLN